MNIARLEEGITICLSFVFWGKKYDDLCSIRHQFHASKYPLLDITVMHKIEEIGRFVFFCPMHGSYWQWTETKSHYQMSTLQKIAAYKDILAFAHYCIVICNGSYITGITATVDHSCYFKTIIDLWNILVLLFYK